MGENTEICRWIGELKLTLFTESTNSCEEGGEEGGVSKLTKGKTFAFYEFLTDSGLFSTHDQVGMVLRHFDMACVTFVTKGLSQKNRHVSIAISPPRRNINKHR